MSIIAPTYVHTRGAPRVLRKGNWGFGGAASTGVQGAVPPRKKKNEVFGIASCKKSVSGSKEIANITPHIFAKNRKVLQ